MTPNSTVEPVKINAFELENVERVRAVQYAPTADGTTIIGGRNGQGKTSILNAIAWGLGGKKYQPDNPNFNGGDTPAKLHIELSNGLVVERRGKNGTLYVTDPNGMKGSQSLLNSFITEFALDLPKFLEGTDKDRTNALLHTIGIDEQLASLDAQIRDALQQRQMAGREASRKRMHADSLPSYDDAPAEPISLADLMRQQREIADRNNENQRKREQLSQLEWQRQSTVQTIDNIDRSIRSAQDQLDQYIRDMQERINGMRRSYEEQRKLLNQQETDLEAMREAVDALVDESTDEIEQNIAGSETINSHVRDNERKAEAEADAATAEQEYANMTGVIDGLRKQRLSLLNGAPLPLPGLSVDEDNNLTYNGYTWSSMSGSEQLRVATAIVRATKPECGFVLVDKLEQMDVQTLAEFGAWAQSEGLQVIGTRVSTGDECTIIIEDGMVDGQ
jgi:DNA repair exonuclease SbcCD ATPase subunit